MEWIDIKKQKPEEGHYIVRGLTPEILAASFFDGTPAKEFITEADWTSEESSVIERTNESVTYKIIWHFVSSSLQFDKSEYVTHYMKFPEFTEIDKE